MEWNLLFIFICHGIFIISVLDIFFKSTVHQNLEPVKSDIKLSDIRQRVKGKGVAEDTDVNRLVLFVCDGLPADYLYEVDEAGSSNIPFIRSVIEEEGSWGLSFTRVPTESRPGHVALIAGLYEDPSAIFQGWQDNPVNFDSVFNRSDITFSWGCEDILNLFEKRTRRGHFKAFKYPSGWQDYSGNDGTAQKLDLWVKHSFETFILEAKANESFNKLVRKPKTVFFFHLLGMDVAGHAYKPKTKYYYNCLRNVDQVVKHIVTLLNDFFQDQKTVFILTSDHGMTDWGSHGASTPIETITPIVAWGTGINKPKTSDRMVFSRGISELNGVFGENPRKWKLDTFLRHDINQADLAVLMSVLLGIPIPVNSLGVLPLSLISMAPDQSSIAYYSNALQLLQQLEAKENSMKTHLASVFFKPYEPLTYNKINYTLQEIRTAILNQNFIEATNCTNKLIQLTFEGMDYYDNYYKSIMMAHLLLGLFSVWMVIIGKILNFWNPNVLAEVGLDKTTFNLKKKFVIICFVIGSTAVGMSIFGKIVPFHYLIYLISSLILILWSILENDWYCSVLKLFLNWSFVFEMILYSLGLQVMVLSFFRREILSVGIISIAAWPFLDKYLNSIPFTEKLKWSSFCMILAIFPMLPIVDKKEIFILRFLAAGFWLYFSIKKQNSSETGSKNIVTKIQNALAYAVLINTVGIFLYFSYGLSYIDFHQAISFILLSVLLGTMNFGSCLIRPRFNSISFSVGSSFLLFAISYEALFPIILQSVLSMWIDFEELIYHKQLEKQHSRGTDDTVHQVTNYISNHDVRRSFIYIFLVFVSFFGVGNLSSINSFNTDWLKSFLTTFQPFPMMALIILRTVLPIFLVTCAFHFIILIAKCPALPMFYLVLLFCDTVAAELLLSVQNSGSWLEIGTSLSRFIIMECIVLFLILLYLILKYITRNMRQETIHPWLPLHERDEAPTDRKFKKV